MKMKLQLRTALTLILTVCLSLPVTVFATQKVDTKKAKKNYSEGMKYEVEGKWDLAAQSFLLAVAADPGNTEYKLHMMRAMQNASLMFTKRGDAFAAENDYASAYTAYKQAAAYDQTNEVAVVKMRRMIELQKAAAGLTEEPKINRITGGYLPTSNDISSSQPQQRSRSKDIATTISYKDTPLKQVVTNISKLLNLNVIFDETFRDEPKYSLELQNTTLARALDFIFIQKKLTFEQLDRRTILVYFDNPTNRQRFERLMVKTFYINNAKLEEARAVVQQMLQGGGAGLPRQIAVSQQLNALIVRAPAEDLKMVQQVLDSIDKNRAEVAIDVEIYEVTHTASQQIGNQVSLTSQTLTRQTGVDGRGNPITQEGSSASLSNLGGILGQGVLAPLVGSAFGIGSGFGALLAAPPTTLSLLQNKSNAKLLSRVQVHAIDGQSNKTNVGRRVPVRLGSTVVPGFSTPTTGIPGTGTGGAIGGNLGGSLGGLGGYSGFDSIQYQDVGLNIDVTPTVTNEGYIEMKMTLESSNTVPGADALTPEFTQRKLTTISRVLDGKTAVVAGIQQQNKSDGRSSIPVIGMIPILGRFITTPRESSDLSDIIITITPHIIRAPEFEKKDHLAKDSGTGLGGNFVSIEQVVMRAQEEDDQDRRIIAAQQGHQQFAPQPTPVVDQAAAPQQPVTNPIVQPAVATPVTPQPTQAVAQVKPEQPKPQPIVEKAKVEESQPSNAEEPQTEEPSQGAITERNTDDMGENKPAFVPPANYRAEVKPFVLTQEQKEAYEAMKLKVAEEAKKNPPPPSEPAKEEPFKYKEPPPGYRPQLKPVPPQKKENTGETAKSEPKEISQLTVPKPAASGGAIIQAESSPFGLSLKLKESPLLLGETFIVVVAVDGNSQLTGANIALNYDTRMLQLKSVRDGGLLGKNPDLTQMEKNGKLLVTVQQDGDRMPPVSGQGKLLVLEFKALSSGETKIAFNNSETSFQLFDKTLSQFKSAPAQLVITRESISKLAK